MKYAIASGVFAGAFAPLHNNGIIIVDNTIMFFAILLIVLGFVNLLITYKKE